MSFFASFLPTLHPRKKYSVENLSRKDLEKILEIMYIKLVFLNVLLMDPGVAMISN